MADKLRLSPEGIAQCVKACDELIDTLDRQLSATYNLDALDGFGPLQSAQMLRAGFLRKASGTPESARERIHQFREIAVRMRENFAAGGEGFAETEAEFASALGNVAKGLEA
ncbi:hypothetical protein G4X40_09710 [Rhodococcus sp. D2-41]|uniref:hypothetical protein n=1 Tax=Speluncibacter jeojiensis TaxID=2710754 RepID=UPI00240FB76E|nr:hypothetical protein [Rhodococcus sp. D2-41]MDG3010421.1 hypothetical protein [Rhodococcus sp. D2-41]